jgi:hypothetical protein
MARRGWPVTRPVRHVGVLPLTIFPIEFPQFGFAQTRKAVTAWHVDKCVRDYKDRKLADVTAPGDTRRPNGERLLSARHPLTQHAYSWPIERI